MKTITGSLVVCVIAGLFAAGALLVDPAPAGRHSAPAPAAAVASPPVTAGDGGPVSGQDTTGDYQGTDGGTGSDGGQGPDGGSGGTGGGAAPATATLTIKNFAYSSLKVAPGTQVTVVNQDGEGHTATAEKGDFDSGPVPANGTANFAAPSDPGTYKVICEVHPGMAGSLTVG